MSLPIAKHRYELGQFATKEDAIKDLRKPSFRLGDEDGWLIERTFVYDEEEVVLRMKTPCLRMQDLFVSLNDNDGDGT